MATIGKRIQQKRKQFKLNQDELAEMIGKSRQMVSYYENGTTEPGLADLKEMAKVFNCTVSYLIGETDEEGKLIELIPQPDLSKSEKANYEKIIGDLVFTVRILSEQLKKHKVYPTLTAFVEEMVSGLSSKPELKFFFPSN